MQCLSSLPMHKAVLSSFLMQKHHFSISMKAEAHAASTGMNAQMCNLTPSRHIQTNCTFNPSDHLHQRHSWPTTSNTHWEIIMPSHFYFKMYLHLAILCSTSTDSYLCRIKCALYVFQMIRSQFIYLFIAGCSLIRLKVLLCPLPQKESY